MKQSRITHPRAMPSPNRHASKHAGTSGHPVAQSFELTEDWYWCYIDQVAFVIPGAHEFSYV
jgi:hypothetical protein